MPLGIHHVEGLIYVKSVGIQGSPVGVVWKLEVWLEAQVSSLSLEYGSIANSPRSALWSNVNERLDSFFHCSMLICRKQLWSR
ncbi:hypothetical protein TNCV_5098651 [Trichonephila clavipes]|uniref:Uncharacterized protein n=1 Tax=Trichonephila clavipes TaxID=2585209 RepID=A0A8X6VC28_TRICX|nr:hypothetical protein TNCV_5098651 [Trichonephila clavipes]